MCSKAVKNYDLIKKIGSGGLCTIWEARHRSSNQTFAFKQLHDKSDYGISVIRDEYKFLAFHKFPGLINAYDFISVAGNTGFVMDYLPGPGLDAVCRILDEQKLLSIMTEILEIANYVYQSGYIYNDYKPQNFMYDSDGKLKLIDFNLISPVGNTEPKTSGTFGYLAPELLTGKQSSIQSDIYSLGVTFYELACGRMPFEAEDEGALIKLITETSPENPGTANESINECLLRMLSGDLSERPLSFHEIARQLGIENKFAADIKKQASHYLNSGISPFASDVLDSICAGHSDKRIFVILANDSLEQKKLLGDLKIILNLQGCRSRDVRAEAQSPELSTPAKFAENFASGDIDRAGGMYLVDCRDDFNDDIFKVAHAIADDMSSGNILLFTTDRTILAKNNKLEIISLIDKPGRTAAYVNYFLKNHSAPESFLARMQDISDGNSSVIYHFLSSFIENGSVGFEAGNWVVSENIDYSQLPSELANLLSGPILRLTDEQKAVLRWLAVMDSFCPADCLDELAGIASAPHLATLINLGLAEKSDTSVKCASTAISLSAYDSISESEKIAMHKKAAAYLEVNYPEQIEVVLHHHRKAGNFDTALNYAYQAALKWNDKFDFKKAEEFIGTAEEMLSRVDSDVTSDDRVLEILFLGADIAKALANNGRAESIYNRAAALAKKINSRESLAKAYKDLGDNYRLQQDTAKSIDYTNKALDLYGQLDDEPALAACFNNLGLAHWIAGDYTQALANFEKSLELNRELGNLSEQSKIHNNIGIIYDITGRTDDVLGRFEEALKCAVEVKNPILEAKYLNNIGYFHLNSGKPQKALDYFMRCYELADTAGNAEEQLNTVYNIALAYHKMGEFLKSAEANQQALDIALSLNHTFFAAQSAHLLARDCLALGNYKLGLDMLEQAAGHCAGLSNAELMADILITRTELELQLGDIEKALNYLADLNSRQIPTSAQKAQTAYINLKLESWQSGGFKAADLDKLIVDARESRNNEIVAMAILEKASIAIAEGRLDETGSLLAEYGSLEISSLLVNFEYSLVMSRYLAQNRQYNEALEITSDIKKTAEEKGCLPILFKSLVRETLILRECRKHPLAVKTIKQAEAVDNILVAAIPETRDPGKFHNSNYGKIFIGLAKELAIGAEINL